MCVRNGVVTFLQILQGNGVGSLAHVLANCDPPSTFSQFSQCNVQGQPICDGCPRLYGSQLSSLTAALPCLAFSFPCNADINECFVQPALNPPVPSMVCGDARATCTDTPSGYECECTQPGLLYDSVAKACVGECMCTFQ